MKQKLLLTTALLLCSLSLFAADSLKSWWQQAARCYGQKQYDSAALYYERIAALKPAGPEVYYNLGNAYYRLNQIGPAVLNYERALKRAPGYKAASDNLLLAQSRIPNRIRKTEEIAFIRWWRGLTRPDRALYWTVTSLVLFVAGVGLLVYRRFRPGASYMTRQALTALAVFWVATFVLAWRSSRAGVEEREAVVLRDAAPLTATPAPAAKPAGLIPEGTTVALEARSGTWARVTLPDGRTGWMLQEHLKGVD